MGLSAFWSTRTRRTRAGTISPIRFGSDGRWPCMARNCRKWLRTSRLPRRTPIRLWVRNFSTPRASLGLRDLTLRDDHQYLGALPSQAPHLVRRLAGEIQTVALRQGQLFAVELDRDPSLDDEKHFFAGMRCAESRLQRRAHQEGLHHLAGPAGGEGNQLEAFVLRRTTVFLTKQRIACRGLRIGIEEVSDVDLERRRQSQQRCYGGHLQASFDKGNISPGQFAQRSKPIKRQALGHSQLTDIASHSGGLADVKQAQSPVTWNGHGRLLQQIKSSRQFGEHCCLDNRRRLISVGKHHGRNLRQWRAYSRQNRPF